MIDEIYMKPENEVIKELQENGFQIVYEPSNWGRKNGYL